MKPKKYLLICIECGKRFFTQGEKDFYLKHKLNFPKRCKKCRETRKQAKQVEEKINIEKTKLANDILNLINNVELVKIEIYPKFYEDTLYIIGNGFDLMHGVSSSYYEFYKFLRKKNEFALMCLKLYVDKENIWADFENSLAYLDRRVIDGVDDALDMFNVYDEDDENFTYADYYIAIEQASSPVTFLTEELPVLFRKWINRLRIKEGVSPLNKILIPNAKYINFNYTEFLETIYGISEENILYLHGCRKNKKEELILGHGNDYDALYDEWFEQNKDKDKNKKSPLNLAYFHDDSDENLDDFKTPLRYYAINEVRSNIENYYDVSKKDTTKIIEKNKQYFQNLSTIKNIVVIGHSLSKVDYPYFKEIIKNNSVKENLKWYISWYNNDDLIRIMRFIEMMKIELNQVTLLKLS